MTNYKEDIAHLFSLFYLPVGEKIFCKIPGQTKTFCQVHAERETGYLVRYLVGPKDKPYYKAEETNVCYAEISYNNIMAW